MDHERESLSGSELVRWLVLVALIVVGIGLFFLFGPSTQPVVPPTVQEMPR